MAHVKRGAAEPPVRLFDAPVRVPSRRALTLAVTLGTWALLVVTVPFYFVFLLNSLPELFAVMGTIRAAARSPHGTVDDAGGAQRGGAQRGGAQRGGAQQTGADPSDD